MIDQNWQIEIRDRPAQMLTDIWIFRKDFDNKLILYVSKGKDGMQEKKYNTGEVRVPATLIIPTDLVPILLEAITSKGIKPPEESFVKGKLEATENHLGDLRKMLKL